MGRHSEADELLRRPPENLPRLDPTSFAPGRGRAKRRRDASVLKCFHFQFLSTGLHHGYDPKIGERFRKGSVACSSRAKFIRVCCAVCGSRRTPENDSAKAILINAHGHSYQRTPNIANFLGEWLPRN